MASEGALRRSYVAVGVGTCVCALPIEHVIETMRVLPLEPISAPAPFIAGISIIRGAPVPVVDLGALLGLGRHAAGSLVTLRLAERTVAVRVDRVLGVRQLDEGAARQVPPLLRAASAEHVALLGSLDAQLLVVLRASALFPAEPQESRAR